MTSDPSGPEAKRLGSPRETLIRHVDCADPSVVRVGSGRQQGAAFQLRSNEARCLMPGVEQGRLPRAQSVQSRPSRMWLLEAR